MFLVSPRGDFNQSSAFGKSLQTGPRVWYTGVPDGGC